MTIHRLLPAALMLALPLSAQFVTDKDEVKVLIPRAPAVKGPITGLLLVASKETDSLQVLKALQTELSRQSAFKVILPRSGDPLAEGLDGPEALSKSQREAAITEYGASHMIWLRLERFSFKESLSDNAFVSAPTAPGQKTSNFKGSKHFKWIGVATAMFHCPVQDLATGALTALPAQNLHKEYFKEADINPPTPENPIIVRNEMTVSAARKALPMVVPVQVVQPLPFQTQGALGKVLSILKKGGLDEALAQTTALAAASGSESPKFQARIQYDLGLLLCLKQRPAEALAALLNAEKAGVDKAEVQKALEACRAMGPGAPR